MPTLKLFSENHQSRDGNRKGKDEGRGEFEARVAGNSGVSEGPLDLLHVHATVVGAKLSGARGLVFDPNDREVERGAVVETLVLAWVAMPPGNGGLVGVTCVRLLAVGVVLLGFRAPTVAHFYFSRFGLEFKGHFEGLEEELRVHCPVLHLSRGHVASVTIIVARPGEALGMLESGRSFTDPFQDFVTQVTKVW